MLPNQMDFKFSIYCAGLSDVLFSFDCFLFCTNLCLFSVNSASHRQSFFQQETGGRACRVPVRHNCRTIALCCEA